MRPKDCLIAKAKCSECNRKATNYFNAIPLCSSCFRKLKGGNKLSCM
jgi:hypothetical protein